MDGRIDALQQMAVIDARADLDDAIRCIDRGNPIMAACRVAMALQKLANACPPGTRGIDARAPGGGMLHAEARQ